MLKNIFAGVGIGVAIEGAKEAYQTKKIRKELDKMNRSLRNAKAKALAQEWYLNKAIREAAENLKRVDVI